MTYLSRQDRQHRTRRFDGALQARRRCLRKRQTRSSLDVYKIGLFSADDAYSHIGARRDSDAEQESHAEAA